MPEAGGPIRRCSVMPPVWTGRCFRMNRASITRKVPSQIFYRLHKEESHSVFVTQIRFSVAIALLLVISACSTRRHFVVPEGSTLFLGGRAEPVRIQSGGLVTVHAFGWDSMGVPPGKGIPYRLEKDGQTVQEGRLRTVLRVQSLFLPPIFGIIAVPTGLNPNVTYNLVTGKQE